MPTKAISWKIAAATDMNAVKVHVQKPCEPLPLHFKARTIITVMALNAIATMRNIDAILKLESRNISFSSSL
jgi:hypothetical protein